MGSLSTKRITYSVGGGIRRRRSFTGGSKVLKVPLIFSWSSIIGQVTHGCSLGLALFQRIVCKVRDRFGRKVKAKKK